jgi:hypothetical protein
MDFTEEELAKAADRIKSAIRGKKKDTDLSTKDMHNAVTKLLDTSKNLTPNSRNHLKQLKAHLDKQIKKDAVQKEIDKNYVKDRDSQKAARADAEAKQEAKEKIATHVAENKPKNIEGIGGSQPTQEMRSKAAGKLTDSIRNKLGTQEGMVVRNKNYGKGLDAQKKLEEQAQKIKDRKGPSETIRVPKQALDIGLPSPDKKEEIKKNDEQTVTYLPNGQWTLN